jgi:FixJ family two-component response regulator
MQKGAEGQLIGIVDDHQSVREGVSSLLRSAGFRTIEFASAEAFLDRDQRYEVSCIVLDIDMSGLGGTELQRLLAQMNVLIPIIFVTAHDDELGGRALKGGAGAVLGKPFSDEDLLDAIRSALKFPGRSQGSK